MGEEVEDAAGATAVYARIGGSMLYGSGHTVHDFVTSLFAVTSGPERLRMNA